MMILCSSYMSSNLFVTQLRIMPDYVIFLLKKFHKLLYINFYNINLSKRLCDLVFSKPIQILFVVFRAFRNGFFFRGFYFLFVLIVNQCLLKTYRSSFCKIGPEEYMSRTASMSMAILMAILVPVFLAVVCLVHRFIDHSNKSAAAIEDENKGFWNN